MKPKGYILFYPLILAGLFIIITNSCKKSDVKPKEETVSDVDGNVYHTVTIGTQVWMVENLKTIRYRDSTEIPIVTSDSAWNKLTSGAYCDYENKPSNSVTYGRLYNWFAINNPRNISPEGWHVPTDEDWDILTEYLGGDSIAGGKLKETGLTHWNSPNTGATNESDFTARPGGYRGGSGSFVGLGVYGNFWSSTDESSALAWGRYLYFEDSNFVRGHGSKTYGFSIRCVKD